MRLRYEWGARICVPNLYLTRRLVEERGGFGVWVLEVEESGFGVEAASEAGEAAGRADDSVTGHDDGDGIAAVGCSDGAGGVGVAELTGELAVAAGFAEGNGEQGFPYILLEWRAAHVEADVEVLALAGEVFGELAFGFDEEGMLRVFDEFAEADAVGTVVFPEDGDEALVADD